MERFIDWVSAHALTSFLIVVTAFAVGYIITHRKSLFYKE